MLRAKRPASPSLRRVLLSGLLFAGGCNGKTKDEVFFPTEGWRESTPEAQGLDAGSLAIVLETAAAEDIDIDSLLVVRRGHVVLDAYFYPYAGDARHDVASVTKSFTTTLAAVALQEGVFESLEQPIMPLVGNDRTAITLQHFVDMTTGLDCGYAPGEPELWDMIHADDWVDYAASLPSRANPGTEFSYCSPGTHMLGAAIGEATGLGLADFATESLFEPLGISDVEWPEDPQGIPLGSGDLQLQPRDMAKLGYLYLQDGMWEDRRLLPADWVDLASSPRVDTGDATTGYSMGWWVLLGDYEGLFEARGRGGQAITIWPDRDLVVVFTGGGADRRAELAPLIVDAIRSDEALPPNSSGQARLADAIADITKAPLAQAVPPLPAAATTVSGQIYALDGRPLDLECLSVTFAPGDTAELQLWREGEAFTLLVGLDAVPRFTERSVLGFPAAVTGAWEDASSFAVRYDEVGGNAHFRVVLDVDASTVSVLDRTGLYPEQVIDAQPVAACG